MHARRVELRDFRNYARAEAELAPTLTIVTGPNGAGKTNLLEGIFFACTARSPRTANERELVRRGGRATRVAIDVASADAAHRVEVGFEPGEPKRIRVDGRAVEAAVTVAERPLVSLFLPERLELVKGPPAGRRGRLDQLVAALWPSRAETRIAYSRALAQRNALLARARAGTAAVSALDAWDAELARHGAQLMADRAEAAGLLAEPFAERAAGLGLGGVELRYRPRSGADGPAVLAGELRERRAADLERGFSAHGPHRDEVALAVEGASLRAFGSQGQQRAALLALLFAERDVLERLRGRPPLMLLDDVMSELDGSRRELLADLLRTQGQAVVTATDVDHIPGAGSRVDGLVHVRGGALVAPARRRAA